MTSPAESQRAIAQSPASANAAGEWRANGTVVVAAAAGMAFSTLISYSLALFIEPIQAEFGWSRAQVTSGQLIAAVAGVLLGPLIGAIIDRVGPRRIGLLACLAMFAAMSSLSLASADRWTWHALWIFVALAIVLIQPTVWTSAITSLFTTGRGLALAVTLCGSGIASIIVPPLTYTLIQNWGWRLTFVLLPAAWCLVVIPLLLLFFKTPLDAPNETRQRGRPSFGVAAKHAVGEQVLTLRFGCLALAGLAFAMVAATLAVSVVPLLTDYGLTRGEAAALASLVGITAIAGRLTIGLLLDRLPAQFVAASCTCLPVIGVLLLLNGAGDPLIAAAAVAVFGLTLGAELDILAYLTSRYFRVENFGMLFGIIGGLVTLAGGTGPVLVNAVFDTFGTYRPALWAVLPASLVAAVLFLLLGAHSDVASKPDVLPARPEGSGSD